jgi:4-amino-4-deoxy-L-arabinose transferase-like glycosyltransferase
LRRHLPFLVLVAIAAPLLFAFALQGKIASFGDDSVSYLVLAHWFSGSAGNAFAAQWAPWHSHFGPLLPALLALSGGASDYRIAYALVALAAVLALPLIYRYGARELGGTTAGLAIVALFLASPTAWISVKGILSESLYLLIAMAALLFHEARLAGGRGSKADRLAFGVLLGCACLTRVVGFALVFAFVACLVVRVSTRKEKAGVSMLLPLLPLASMLALWHALRPVADVDTYQRTAISMIGKWIANPVPMLGVSADYIVSAWVASFGAQPGVSAALAVPFMLLGLLALAGMVLRILRNRMDAWFLLASLALIFPWVFTPDNTRRLVYPLVPLLLICAADFLRYLCDRWQVAGVRRTALLAGAFTLQVVLCLPALLALAEKSGDRREVKAGYGYAYRDIYEYYTTLDRAKAAELADMQVMMLGGLEAIDRVAPAGARVMWMRPEYVGLLGKREGVPYFYRWSGRELAREVRKARADYIVLARLFKTDNEGATGDPFIAMAGIEAWSRPAFHFGHDGFMLMEVDKAALDRFLLPDVAQR